MSTWISLTVNLFRFYSEFLSFLKNEDVLESYIFSYTDLKTTEIKEEIFLPAFAKLINELKTILHCGSSILCADETEDINEIPSLQSNENSNDLMIGNKLSEDEANYDTISIWQSNNNSVTNNKSKDDRCVQNVKFEKKNKFKGSSDSSAPNITNMTREDQNIEASISEDNAPYPSQILKVIKLLDGTYQCSLCNKKFPSRSSTVRHYKSHTGERPYSCEYCQKKFASKIGVESHQLREHNLNTDSALSCSECGKLFSRRNALDVHMKIHTSNKPFHCEQCGKSFTQKISLDIHAAKHTGKYDFYCTVCQKPFATRAKLNSHMYIHQTPRFTCDLCGRQFVRHDTLLVHRRTHSGERPFCCEVCTRTFLSKSSLHLHQQIHSDIHPFKCVECKAEFKQKTGLVAHVRRRHNPTTSGSTESSDAANCSNTVHAQQFLCPQCGQEFQRKQSLLEHERVHCTMSIEELRPHACHLCPKRFAQKSKLGAHIRTHLQEPSHECNICGKRFHRKDALSHHVFLHTNKRPYSCAHCDKAFATKFNLSVHLSTHSPAEAVPATEHQCLECGKKFKHKNTFNLHMKTHTGNFNYTCVTCGKKFMKKSHYEGHLRSHDTDRPFQCPTCGKRYKERKHCREHVRKMHPSGFSLATLFASITNEDAQMDDMLCTQEHEPDVNGLAVPGQQITTVSESNCVSTIDTSFLLNSQVNLSEASLSLSTAVPSLEYAVMEPILQQIHIPETSQFLMTNTRSLPLEDTSCQVDVANTAVSLTILSIEDATTVLSQSLET